LSEHTIDIFIDTTNINIPDDKSYILDQPNMELIYIEEIVIPLLEQIYICGIPGITDIYFTKDNANDTWYIETDGFNSKTISSGISSFKRVLALPYIEYSLTISNNVWDIYEVFDIEAARQFLIEEFMSIMEGINICHANLLVDRMTFSGSVSSITRYTLKNDASGPMGKASFEETMDNFLNAAIKGEHEPTNGISASIICGKQSLIGTGMVNVMIDIPALPKVHNTIDICEEDVISEFTF
jgi:DNA-directed RNA polymerase beta' subunit